MRRDAAVIALRRAGTSIVLDARGPGMPAVVHWGADLGDLSDAELVTVADVSVPAIPHSALDVPVRVRLLNASIEGWPGRPGLAGLRGG